jgi:hypothetical protein
MNYRSFALFGAVVAVVALASVPLGGQAPRGTDSTGTAKGLLTPPRTLWGDPDLQGTWLGVAGPSLERPKRFAEREFLTDDEVAARVRAMRERDRKRLAGEVLEYGHRLQPNYNGIFQPTPTLSSTFRISRRTSQLIDPPDGRLPPLTPEAVKRWEQRELASRGRGESDTPLDRAIAERCLNVESVARVSGWGLGGAVFDAAVESAATRLDIGLVGNTTVEGEGAGGGGAWRRILQAPGYVAMLMQSEGGGGGQEKVRMIPLDRRPALGPAIRQYMGDARGHWEGNTLVVEITNLIDADPIFTTYGQSVYPGSAETLRITERYTLVDANNMEYRATIEDPAVYTRPYTLVREMTRDDSFKIAPELCHENNRDMGGILTNARSDEPAALEFAQEAVQKRQQRLAEEKAEWAALNKSR